MARRFWILAGTLALGLNACSSGGGGGAAGSSGTGSAGSGGAFGGSPGGGAGGTAGTSVGGSAGTASGGVAGVSSGGASGSGTAGTDAGLGGSAGTLEDASTGDAEVDASVEDAAPDVVEAAAPICLGCTELATAQGIVTDLAIDATTVYFVSGNPAGVRSVPKSGGSVTALVTGGSPSQLVLDVSHIYYTDSSPPSIVKMDKDGSNKQTLASVGASAIAVNSTWLFWVTGTSVTRANKDGTNPTVIHGPGTAGAPMVADEFNLFFYSKNAVYKAAFGGGIPWVILANQAIPKDMAFDADSIAWTASNKVLIADKSSLAFNPPISSGPLFADGLAIDSSGVYWGGYVGVSSAKKDGSQLTTFATGQGGVPAVAVDATDVFWASTTNGTVMKAPK